MTNLRRRITSMAIALAAVAGVVVLSPMTSDAAPAAGRAAEAPAAVTDDSCTPLLGCSQIQNPSPYYVAIRPNWTTCGGGTGASGPISCTSGTTTLLYSGNNTPTNQDWDTFRVDPGWCYRVKFYLPYRSWTERYNRVGLGETWVKVEDWATAVIEDQRYGSCP
jgi:hypothetical protein